MDKSIPTEYTAVPPAAYPPTMNTEEEHQVTAPTHPLLAPEPLPPYVDSSKLLAKQLRHHE